MKIWRHGFACELTDAEMREVYLFMKRAYLKEDIESQMEEMEIELSNENIDDIVNRVSKVLSNNDSYWEAYWMTIQYAIEQVKE